MEDIIVTSFPITEAASFYSNVFRGFVKEEIELFFATTDGLVTDNGGFVSIEITDLIEFDPLYVGDDIVFKGAGLDFVVGKIISQGASDVLTDIPFVASAGTNYIYVAAYEAVNFPNLRMSYRFAEFTTQDDQSAANLFGTDFTFYPDNKGRLFIDISLISSLMKPNFDFTNEINTDMSKVYQVQYRPVYDGSSETWVSAHDSGLTAFVPFISIHAGGRIAKADNSLTKATPDFNLITRMWRGYKKILSAYAVDANESGIMIVHHTQYNNAKASVASGTLFTSSSDNGMVNVTLPTLNAATRYILFDISDDGSQLSESYFTVFDTLQDETEFYLTWASELGTIRNWLFTSKIDFGNKASYDVLQDTTFRGIPNRYDEKLLLQTKGLSEIEKNYVYDVYLSNKIIIENDGEEVECIVSKPSFSFENRSNSYICTIEVQKKQRDLMNV